MSFICTNCGDCCGPVGVSEYELKKIQRTIKKFPGKFKKIREQKRDLMTCMFRDTENNNCSIYNVRPESCRMFGYYEGLQCPNNPEYATKDHIEGNKRLNKSINGSKPAGVLTMDITWSDILKR